MASYRPKSTTSNRLSPNNLRHRPRPQVISVQAQAAGIQPTGTSPEPVPTPIPEVAVGNLPAATRFALESPMPTPTNPTAEAAPEPQANVDANPAGSEPAPGSPEALAQLSQLGIAPRAEAGAPLGPDDERFSPLSIGHLTHRLVEVKRMLDQLGSEQKELHETLRLAHLRGDLLHLLPPGTSGGYQLPGGVLLHRRPGRKQWTYSPDVQELEAQLKAQQVYEQSNGEAIWSLGAAFWELRFPKG